MKPDEEREPSAMYLDSGIEIVKRRRELLKRLREATLAGDTELVLQLAREYTGLVPQKEGKTQLR